MKYVEIIGIPGFHGRFHVTEECLSFVLQCFAKQIECGTLVGKKEDIKVIE